MQGRGRLLKMVVNWSASLSVLLLVSGVGLICVHVFARYVLNRPLLFAEELCGYILAWIVFLSLPHTMKTGGHVRVDLFYGRLSGRTEALVDNLLNILGVLFALVFLTGNILLVRQFYIRGTISTTDLQIPLVFPAIVMIIGSLLLLFQMVGQLWGGQKED